MVKSKREKFNAKSDTPRGQKVLYSVDDLDYGNHTIKVCRMRMAVL